MLKTYIKQQKIKSGSVFITKSGKPLDRSAVWKMLKGLCESANVARNKVFPHNFRHLFAKTFYSLQKDIVKLVEILYGKTKVNAEQLPAFRSIWQRKELPEFIRKNIKR